MQWKNTETPTFTGSDGTQATGPDVVETLQLLDRDGNVLATFTKSVVGALSFALTGDMSVSGSLGIPTVSKLSFANGQTFSALATAITANSTTTSEPAGSIAITSHATGVGKLFMSDGTKWQYAVVA